jgi:hypothetical protein
LRGNKNFGAAVEQLFYGRAMMEGLDVFIPAGDYLQQDCMVVNGAGKIYRVQIKGTEVQSANEIERKTERWRITAQRSKSLPLDCSKVDIMAAYVKPYDVWYMVPCLQITSRTVWLYPENPSSKNKYEKYREDWDLFKL